MNDQLNDQGISQSGRVECGVYPISGGAPEPGEEPPAGEEIVKVKLGDEEVPISEIESWKEDSTNKSNWQKKLTQEAQQLADDKRAAETEKKTWDDWATANPEKAEMVSKLYRGEEIAPAQPSGDELGEFGEDPVKKELAQVKKDLADLNRKIAVNAQEVGNVQLEREIADVRREFGEVPNERIDELLAISSVRGNKPLIEIARGQKKAAEEEWKSRLGKWIKDKKLDNKLATEGPGGGAPPPVPANLKLEDGSVRRAAVQYLEKSG